MAACGRRLVQLGRLSGTGFLGSPSGFHRGFSRIDGYVHYYGKLKNHEGMLRDSARNEAYDAALARAAPKLRGATVMDIGTGSGILALLAAKHGARKVYAVEGSPEIARVASRLARANGYAGVVEVIPKHLEDVTVEEVEQVDVIVSELFSHFLVGELGLQAVTHAVKRFLKPGGLVLPAAAWLKLSPFEDPSLGAELRARHGFWQNDDFMGFDLTSALPLAVEQQMKELVLDIVDPNELLVSPADSPGHFLDLAGPKDVEDWRKIDFELKFPERSKDALIDGLCGWWDAIFSGDGMGEVGEVPVLSTSPAAPLTVWAHCRFMLSRPLKASAMDKLRVQCQLRSHKLRESYTLSMELCNDTTRERASVGPVELSDVYARHFARPNPFPLKTEAG
ncbi:CARM1 [Symbiodinium natans]|uniref:type I protein arginine methyltransferase n=1 Tax=Symbiodinium natans TaxID=878477 RepID=A0A812RH54_9DINO|nr:CARM1 [Symbiodinium natans]